MIRSVYTQYPIRGTHMISKRLYTEIFNHHGTHRQVRETISEIATVFWAFRDILDFFEKNPQFTVHIDGVTSTLYEYTLRYEKENFSTLNLYVYKNGVIIGNIADGWIDDGHIPDHVKDALLLIY